MRILKKICVIGLGYIGLPTASMLATHGFEVIGMDIDPQVVDIINRGGVHIEEPGLKTLVRAAIKSGNLTASTMLQPADVFIIAVPTPLTAEKKADLSYVKQAAQAIVPHLAQDNLVILESTSPPGTCMNILIPFFESFGLKVGKDYYLAHCPERVMPGNTLKELINNDRIIGGYDQKSIQLTLNIYQVFVEGKIHATDTTTAEFVKLMENTYRDVNIALANELAVICDDLSIDAWEVIRLANLHPRVNIHNPGPGVGGHCLAVDPWFIVEKSPDKAKIISQGRIRNESMPEYTVQKIKTITSGISNPKVTILGVSYKGNIDDIRESPALKVLSGLEKEGIKYAIYDPHVKYFDYELSSLHDAFVDSDCVVILADHDEFKFLHPSQVASMMKHQLLLDTRHFVNGSLWKESGFDIFYLGSGNKTNL